MERPMVRPSAFPDLAMLDQTSEVSGQNNVFEPPQAYKYFGYPYRQPPPRQFFNWLGRNVAQLIHYIDEQLFDTDRQIVIYDGYPVEEGVWVDHEREYWDVGSWLSDGGMYFDVPAKEGMIITRIEAKVFNHSAIPRPISVVPFFGNAHFDVAGTAPEWYGATLHTAEVAGESWAIISSGTISLTINEGYRCRIKVIPDTVGDRCAGVQVTYRPLSHE